MNEIINYNIKPEFSYKLTSEQLNIIRPYKDLTYLDTIVAKLIEVYKLDLTAEQKDNLHTYVYLASDQFRQEVKDEKQAKLVAEGWKPLTKEVAKELDNQKIELIASRDIDWFTDKISKIVKVQVLESGIFLLPPRYTRRGYYLATLEMPMYKTI